jgi:hypothetical protein
MRPLKLDVSLRACSRGQGRLEPLITLAVTMTDRGELSH